MNQGRTRFDEVFDAELQEIGNRRKKHRLPDAEPETTKNRRESLVGLALSGGGVRSAGVALGVVQAFYRNGFLKAVNYLSTVSGGGYAGALLSSEIASKTEGIGWEGIGTENRLSIDPPSETGQPGKVYALSFYGRRMGDVVKMLSRHLFGWILTVAFLMSGIICVASLMAWLMRQCWTPTGMALLPCFGFRTDIERAFFPAFLAVLLWGFSLAVQQICQIFSWTIPPTARITYLLLLSTLILGVLVLMGIEDVGIKDWMELYGLPVSLKRQVEQIIQSFTTVVSIAVMASLIPFFAPKALLNSGRRDGSLLQRTIFNFAGYGVIFAVPLFIFYFVARENISDHHRDIRKMNAMTAS